MNQVEKAQDAVRFLRAGLPDAPDKTSFVLGPNDDPKAFARAVDYLEGLAELADRLVLKLADVQGIAPDDVVQQLEDDLAEEAGA